MLVTCTGIHKSGNSWLVALLADLCQTTGEPPADPTPADLPLASGLARHLCLHDILQAVAQTHPRNTRGNHSSTWLPQSIACRLFGQTSGELSLSATRAEQIITALALRIRWSLARYAVPDYLTVEQIKSFLRQRVFPLPAAGPSPNHRRTRPTERQPVFVPAKHLPLDVVQQRFPDFRVIWLQRDPRDGLVSWFYHDLAVLTGPKLDWLSERIGQRYRLKQDWQQAYLAHRSREQSQYYMRSLPTWTESSTVYVVRYEELLKDTERVLKSIARFLEIPAAPDRLKVIAERYSMDALRQTTGRGAGPKQPAGFVRRGAPGEWKQSLGNSVQESFDDHYTHVLQALGYEAGRSWRNHLPQSPVSGLDISRFRQKSSAVYHAQRLWLGNPQLRERFPFPFDWTESDCWFEYLSNCSEPDIRSWFDRVTQIWGPPSPDEYRYPADQRLGY